MTSPAARPDDFAQGPTKPQATIAPPTSKHQLASQPIHQHRRRLGKYNLKSRWPRGQNAKLQRRRFHLRDEVRPKAKRPEATPNFNSTLACQLRHHRHAWTGSCSQLRYRWGIEFFQHDHLIPQWDGIKHAQKPTAVPQSTNWPHSAWSQHGQSGNRRQQTRRWRPWSHTLPAVCRCWSQAPKVFEGHPKVYPRSRRSKNLQGQPILSPSEMFMAATTAPRMHPVSTARKLS